MKKKKIHVYAINLPTRSDRKANIMSQFTNKEEFELHIISGLSRYKNGALNLWKTLQEIICKELNSNRDYFILCEDDHQFTNNYSFEVLTNCIEESIRYKADILLGGVSSFQKGVPISNNLFWVDNFSGLQFTIIFRQFYESIISSYFSYLDDVSDHKISSLTSRKFVIYPFISIQKEFGYSDVTQINSVTGTVDRLFANSEKAMSILRRVYDFNSVKIDEGVGVYNQVSLYTDDVERWDFIQDPQMLTMHMVESFAPYNKKIVQKILKEEMRKRSEIFILQLGEMNFKQKWIERFLLFYISEGKNRKLEIMLGDIPDFKVALPITQNLFWIDQFQNTSFIIIFERAYKTILKAVEKAPVYSFNFYKLLSVTLINKAILFPSIEKNGTRIEQQKNMIYLRKIKSLFKKILRLNSLS